MFTIIGGDGKEYGPASVEQLRTWIAAGRVSLETQAKVAGSDEWRRLGDYPEFSVDPTTPPMLPVSAISESDLADRGVRLLARLLDEICSIACALPGAALLGFSFITSMLRGEGGLETLDLASAALGLSVMAFGLLAITLVQIWMITTRGQTIGKRVFGIRIVKLADGTLPGFVQGWLLRNFVPGIIGLVPMGLGLLFSIVDACFIFRADRRCLHDLIATTRVVRA